ncbi:hypothetical protein ACFV2N_29830 [Streptomyces sp. NPDC059680]|uniref:hypothetical protein n=1 Tax=Streptomyces sp. NPDC059680 TaxID=3346904 RepID=UPI0036C91CDB
MATVEPGSLTHDPQATAPSSRGAVAASAEPHLENPFLGLGLSQDVITRCTYPPVKDGQRKCRGLAAALKP